MEFDTCFSEIQDAAGEIFDRDAALDALIEDALFDRDEVCSEMDDIKSVWSMIDDALWGSILHTSTQPPNA